MPDKLYKSFVYSPALKRHNVLLSPKPRQVKHNHVSRSPAKVKRRRESDSNVAGRSSTLPLFLVPHRSPHALHSIPMEPRCPSHQTTALRAKAALVASDSYHAGGNQLNHCVVRALLAYAHWQGRRRRRSQGLGGTRPACHDHHRDLRVLRLGPRHGSHHQRLRDGDSLLCE